MKRLTGKVALITAGPDGIDATTARALADDGADVAISYSVAGYKTKALVRELRSRGIRAAAFPGDECDVSQLETLCKVVIERFGRLDLLIWQPCTKNARNSQFSSSKQRSHHDP